MLYERDIYGAEGRKRTPQEEEEIARETEMELLSEMEPGPNGEPPTVALKIDRRAQTVTLYDRLTDEILFHTSISDYEKLLKERELQRHLGRPGRKES